MKNKEVARIVSPAEKERLLEELMSSAEPRQNVSVPLRELTGNEGEFFTPPSGVKPIFVVADDPQAKISAGITGQLLTPKWEQTCFPKLNETEVSVDDSRYFALAKPKSERIPLLEGELFVVFEAGVVQGVTSNGSYYTALNFTIQIMEEIRTYSDSINYATSLLIRVITKSGNEHEFVVKTSEYGRLYEIIKSKMPGVFRHSKAINASLEYFAKCYDERGNLPIKNLTVFCGWYEIDGVIRYRIGTKEIYKNMVDPYAFEINTESVVREGIGFLAVGKFSAAVNMLFLFAHVAYLLFWFERQGIHFHSVLYIVGLTGSLKTAVAQVLNNVLDLGDKFSNGIRMSSTKASTINLLRFFQDTFILIDDHSNNNEWNNSKAISLRYDITRILCDDTVETKMDFSQDYQIADSNVRTVVAFSAEDLMDVGRSTELRTVNVEFGIDSIDARLLTGYQKKDGPMLRYFAGFIRFLTEYGRELETDFNDTYLRYRSDYGERFPGMRRLADTAAQLRLTVDVICRFLDVGNYDDIEPVAEMLITAIEQCLGKQAELADSIGPDKRFVVALFNSLVFDEPNANAGIASSEAEYNSRPKAFIGFRGNKGGEEVVQLRFDEAWSLADKYFQKNREHFYTKKETVKNELVLNRLILGTPKTATQKGVYSFRKGKEPRDRMTIFRMKAVDEILDQREE